MQLRENSEDLDKMVNLKLDGTPQKIMLGEENGQSKLRIREVVEILRMRKNGESYPKIAKKFNVCAGTIQPICIGKTWRVALQNYFEKYKRDEEINSLLEFYEAVDKHGSEVWRKKVSRKCKERIMVGKFINHKAYMLAGKKSGSLKTSKQLWQLRADRANWLKSHRGEFVEARCSWMRSHPDQQIVARIFRGGGGRKVMSSDPQDKIYEWAKLKFSEEIKLNYPFEFNGKYAFGDVTFIDRKLVIEYDEKYWHNKLSADYEKNRDGLILNNGFSIVHFNYVCFEELERVINSYPINPGGV